MINNDKCIDDMLKNQGEELEILMIKISKYFWFFGIYSTNHKKI